MLGQRREGRWAKIESLLRPFIRLPDLGNDRFTRRVRVEQVDPIAWFYGPVSAIGPDHTRSVRLACPKRVAFEIDAVEEDLVAQGGSRRCFALVVGPLTCLIAFGVLHVAGTSADGGQTRCRLRFRRPVRRRSILGELLVETLHERFCVNNSRVVGTGTQRDRVPAEPSSRCTRCPEILAG
jgi:hypothetical protein